MRARRAGAAAVLAACLAAPAGVLPGCRDGGADDAPAAPVVTTEAGAEMVHVPAGRFTMGSNDHRPNEAPAHPVWVDAFLMDRCEVTQEQFRALEVPDPSHFKGARLPVEQVTFAEVVAFCNERSRAEGLQPCYVRGEAGGWECNFAADGYRLPTEAEWEYACRAGTTGERFFGRGGEWTLKRYAWMAANAGGRTHAVGSRKPNPWGLYDMYGNVAEWCNDRYRPDAYVGGPSRNPRGPSEGKLRVIRGGAWDAKAGRCRSGWRAGEDPRFQDICFAKDTTGFRCVRRAPAPPAATRPQATTGLVYDEACLRHRTSEGHPESPARLKAIAARLTEAGLMDRLVRLPARAAARRWLTTVHEAKYVDRVKAACARGEKRLDTSDTPISAGSFDAAAAGAGGVLNAVDAVMHRRVRNAFCAVRPPGHHATRDKAMGFCLFNNVAVAARYVQRKHRLEKVLIVDWDVHHGNGTQAAFYDDPSVMYFSVHQWPLYPGTGRTTETGAGRGKGTTINVPLKAGAGDAEYRRVFTEVLLPRALAFKPDFVLISAGFDAHADDPLGGMKLTPKGFAELTRLVKRVADRCCRGRVVSVLEGGYNLPGLAASVEAHVAALAE